MKGPTVGHICNANYSKCEFLDAWYNGGMSVYGRCKKGAWKYIRSWTPRDGCDTPKTCPFLNSKKETINET